MLINFLTCIQNDIGDYWSVHDVPSIHSPTTGKMDRPPGVLVKSINPLNDHQKKFAEGCILAPFTIEFEVVENPE